MERIISNYNRIITALFVLSVILNIALVRINTKSRTSELESDIKRLTTQAEAKDQVIKFYKERFDSSSLVIEKEIKYIPYIKIKEKYEKITDTIYADPFKRDSITYYRLLYYIQNRGRFSAEGFNVD